MAIDFSLANLTFDDNAALHRVKTGRPNLYIDVFSHLTRLIPSFSVPFCLPFGYGAKTNPKLINEASECFAISGNFFRPEVSFHDLLEKYSAMLRTIELALPVRLGSVLQLAIDIAEEEKNLRRTTSQNYYFLFVITAGVIDDFEDVVLPQLARVAPLPLSVFVFTVANRNLKREDMESLRLQARTKAMQSQRTFLETFEVGDLNLDAIDKEVF